MSPARLVLGGAGVLVAAYGGFRLVELGWDNLVATAVWLAGGVLLHDVVLAPLVLVLTALAAVAVRSRTWRATGAAVLVVLGSVTLVGVPVLGRFGAKADNPTLLDRPYWTGWLVLVAVVLVVAGLSGLVSRRRPRA